MFAKLLCIVCFRYFRNNQQFIENVSNCSFFSDRSYRPDVQRNMHLYFENLFKLIFDFSFPTANQSNGLPDAPHTSITWASLQVPVVRYVTMKKYAEFYSVKYTATVHDMYSDAFAP